MEDIILDIKKLRYFTSEINNKKYGDFYVTTTEGKYYVFLNDDEIYIMTHYINSNIQECMNRPTEKFIKEFFRKLNLIQEEN